MKKNYINIILLLFSVSLWCDRPVLSIWNNLRSSAYTENNQIHIRYESIDLPLIDSQLFFKQSDFWESVEIDFVEGLTYEAIIDADPSFDIACRLKTGTESLTAMMPAIIESDNFPPAASELSFICADPAADTLVSAPTSLDILGTYSGYSEDDFFVALKNDGSGFPTDSGGFIPNEFYIYLAGLANPETALEDTVIYGMVYSNIPFIFESGLYRIVGSQLDLNSFQQIGDVETQIIDSLLIMKTDFSVITEDEYFGEWPSITNSLALDFLTVKFALPTEFGIVDFSMPSLQFIDKFIVPAGENSLPEISNVEVENVENLYTITVNYRDIENNFPLIAEIVVDGQETYDLEPQSLDYSEDVLFQTSFLATVWDHILIRFSDDGFNLIEVDYYYTGTSGNMPVVTSRCDIYPNPFNPASTQRSNTTTISFSSIINDVVSLEIYNSRGQLINSLLDKCEIKANESYELIWSGLDQNNRKVSSGIYLVKLTGQNTNLIRKVSLLK